MRFALLVTFSFVCFTSNSQDIKPLVFRLDKPDTVEVDNDLDEVSSATQMMWVSTNRQPSTLQPRVPVYASLDLSYSELRTVPFDYCAHDWMSSVNLEGNSIRKVGQRFGKVSTDTLLLAHNNVTVLKSSGLFYRLVYLDLSDNRVSKIPVDWTGMYRLTHIDLSQNRIDDLSPLFAPPAAEIIFLEGNAITNLPRKFKSLRSLYHLDVSNNKLRLVPRSLAKLHRLEILDVSQNQIKKIPAFMHRMRFLRTLDVSGNPLELRDVERLRKSLPNCEVIFN